VGENNCFNRAVRAAEPISIVNTNAEESVSVPPKPDIFWKPMLSFTLIAGSAGFTTPVENVFDGPGVSDGPVGVGGVPEVPQSCTLMPVAKLGAAATKLSAARHSRLTASRRLACARLRTPHGVASLFSTPETRASTTIAPHD
jgi:hypothetical protein